MNGQIEQKPLNHKTLDVRQIETILDAKETNPEQYQKYLEEIQESSYFNKGGKK